jgi:hypothetical protein
MMLNVPEKTIAAIPIAPADGYKQITFEEICHFIKPLNDSIKRDWFSADFYKCLPLSIGNMQGFSISIPFDFDVFWNGGDVPSDVAITFYDDKKHFNHISHLSIGSHFGFGIVTIHLPIMLKTPDMVNLMTIAPPNFPTPGFSVLTGVIESDNLRYTPTFNFKMDVKNETVRINKGTPIIGILPIPRYFCDQFEIVESSTVFDEGTIKEEQQVAEENFLVDFHLRNKNIKKWWDACYFDGTDIRGNKFKNHQLPNVRKNNDSR